MFVYHIIIKKKSIPNILMYFRGKKRHPNVNEKNAHKNAISVNENNV
jgi:hypothetical protein